MAQEGDMLSQTEVVTIMRNALSTTILAALPMLGVALLVGVVVSVFQATTQINEQTLAFVPKIIGIFLAILIFWRMDHKFADGVYH